MYLKVSQQGNKLTESSCSFGQASIYQYMNHDNKHAHLYFENDCELSTCGPF